MRRTVLAVGAFAAAAIASIGGSDAQGVGGPGQPWRGAGPQPCFGADNGVLKCAADFRTVAIRAGRLFDSNTGRVLTDQVIVTQGDRIADIGPAAQVKIPAGAQVIDLSRETVLPGLIDAHTHMFNTPKPGMSREASTLIAIQHLQSDLNAGFTTVRDMSTHGNGYADVDIRKAIDSGMIDGPRAQVSTRGIVWAGAANAEPENPLASAVVHNVEDARAAVDDQIRHGADWIKLFPTGAYKFRADGKVDYVLTYPMPVLQALIDETHKLGHKAACHVYGGEGERNAIQAGCDTIEHAFDLDQDQANQIVAKGLAYDPTLVRYTEPYMDDSDSKATGGKYRISEIFAHAVAMANKTKGMKLMVGSGVDGATYAHGTQALDFAALVKLAGLTPAQAIQSGTIINAEVLGWKDRVGSIDKGKFADIVATAGDPTEDITELQRINFVMKGGKVIRNDAGLPQTAGR
jgi:imidazolonepropionase-like amidohydrolase